MTATTLNFCELVDLAVGTPTINRTNLSILHSLLKVISSKFGIGQLKVEFMGDDAKKIQDLKEEVKCYESNSLSYNVIESPEVKIDKDSIAVKKVSSHFDHVKAAEIKELENKISKLTSHVEAMLPAKDAIRTQSSINNTQENANNSILVSRITALEESSEKLTTILESVCRNQYKLRVALKENFPDSDLEASEHFLSDKQLLNSSDDESIKMLMKSHSRLEEDFHALSQTVQKHMSLNAVSELEELKGKVSKLEGAAFRTVPRCGACSPCSADSEDRLNHEDDLTPAEKNSERKRYVFSFEGLHEREKKRLHEKLLAMSKMYPILDPNMGLSWFAALENEFSKLYFKKLNDFLKNERASKTVYPPERDVWNWTRYCSVEEVKVVIVGEDPYHNPKQACGMCFSVAPGVAVPTTLQNVFIEIRHNFKDIVMPNHGYLVGWALQGVLLLNSVLTVEAKRPSSHKHHGWELLTSAVLKHLNDYCDGLVFLLWGAYAQKKGHMIDPNRHHILKAGHPSPVSATRAFLGCRHFIRCNELLTRQGKTPIQWDWLPRVEPKSVMKKPSKKLPVKEDHSVNNSGKSLVKT